MLKRILISAGSLGIVCLLVFLGLAWRPAIAPVNPPAKTNFPDDMIAKGESLAGAGHCAVCHTRSGGEPFAGGLGLQTPFGHRPRRNKSAWLAQEAKGGEWKAACNKRGLVIRHDLATEWRGY